MLDLHRDWNRDQIEAANDRYYKREPSDLVSEAKLIALETFIPRDASDGWNEQCRMFHEKDPPATPTQLALVELREFVGI